MNLAISPELRSFSEFWPYYVSVHSKRATRILHVVGTVAGLGLALYGVHTGTWLLIPASLVVGYGFAWFAHFVIERNKPATFRYPLWSARADFKMLRLVLTGRMDAEIARLSQG